MGAKGPAGGFQVPVKGAVTMLQGFGYDLPRGLCGERLIMWVRRLKKMETKITYLMGCRDDLTEEV